MRKSVMLVAALLVSTAMFGQHHKSPEQRAQSRSEKMKAILSLSEAQYATVKRINENYAQQQAELQKDTAGNRDERRRSLRDLHTAREKEINAVLTAEQQANWRAHRVERRQEQKENIHQARSNYYNRIRERLSLTDDQFARMQEADKKFLEQLKTLRNGNKGFPRTKKAAYDKLKSEHEMSVKSILTAEQFQQWIDLKAEMKSNRAQRRG